MRTASATDPGIAAARDLAHAPSGPPAAPAALASDPLATPSDELLARLDGPGPRYTSYPTADRFVEAFGPREYRQALMAWRQGAGAAVGGRGPLSVYVHIPFCESVCYYCACNKVITRRHERASPYLDDLALEMGLHAQVLGGKPPVGQLHLGGGSPTFLTDHELRRLMTQVRAHFELLPDAECSIEVDPRTVDARRLASLRAMGFSRLSFGVQDFDAQVQEAVHRVQPREQVEALVRAARDLGFASIAVDLIHGLPRQTPASVARTVEQVAQLRPDRVALYGYAHLPQRFKPQRRIDASTLPTASERVAMLSGAIAGFLRHGYTYIGMDHFALPGDGLAAAKRQGRLHRNFQGYSTQPDGDQIGLGVSAIGRIGATYSQNAKTLPEYHDAVRAGELPIARGLALDRDDLLRRAVIMAVMCQGRVDFESIELAHLIDFREHFADELARLADLAALGLVTLEPDALQVTPMGWYLVRAVAMVFDRYVQADHRRERFSRLI
jgi:oxygen-independent coproporphyrinogen-3 oxidase